MNYIGSKYTLLDFLHETIKKVTGYEDGTFRPNQPISRQEAAKIIAKLHNKNVDVEIEGQDTKTNFKDDADIAIWADESVDALTKAGVITGYEDNTLKHNSLKLSSLIFSYLMRK